MNLPDWLLDNPYVVDGYRPQESYQGVIKELFSWHNETINAWTMVLVFIVSLILCIKYGMSNTNKTLLFKLSVIAFLLHVCLIVPVSINYHLKAHESYEARSKVFVI
jgi:predicted membrane channel-forming protein YqfA (hemolysin III family)